MFRLSHLPRIVILLALLFFVSCNTKDDSTNPTSTDPTASKTKSDEAYALMEVQMSSLVNGNYETTSDFDHLKFSNVNSLFREAVTLNPENYDAQFGAAISEILAVYSDTAINRLIKDFEKANTSSKLAQTFKRPLITTNTSDFSLQLTGVAQGMTFILQKAMTDPPLVSRVQSVIKTNFIPHIDYAIQCLEACEKNANFTFKISGKMQGESDLTKAVVVYPTEVYLMDGMMRNLRSSLKSFLIYKFELPDYSQSSLYDALAPSNTNFFYISSEGKAYATSAKSDMDAFIAKIKAGISSLEKVSGTKTDAIIKIGNGGIKQSDLDTLKKYLDKVESAMSNDLSIELKDADSDGNSYTIKVNLGNFFKNIPDNPKTALLPAYTVTKVGTKDINIKFNAETYAAFTFPDPTFGGLFPGMTNDVLKRLLRIDERYTYQLNGWVEEFYGSNSPNIYSIEIMTQSGKTYSTQTYSSYNQGFEFVIKNVSNIPDPIVKYYLNGYEYSFVNSGTVINVAAKERDYINMFAMPINATLSASAQTNPVAVNLQLIVNSYTYYWSQNYFAVERKIGSGSFSEISPSYNSYYCTDNNVIHGTQYGYRVKVIRPTSASYSLLYPVDTWYSNVATVTP